MSIVVSHPTGISNLRALLRLTHRYDLLDSFWTSVALPPKFLEAPFLPQSLRRQLKSRMFGEVPWTKTRIHPAREAARLLAKRLRIRPLVRHETGWASVDQVYHSLDRRVAKYVSRTASDILAVYCYEDGALKTFAAASERGIKRIYHLPIPYWKKTQSLLREEAELQPTWAQTMGGLLDSEEKLARKDAEIRLANRIVVASSFTQRSIEEYFGERLPITVASYGAPKPLVAQPFRRAPGEPLELFYAGHLSQRKGVAYLIAALHKLDVPWRLTLAGPRPDSAPKELDAFLADPRCVWLGRVPHLMLLEAMTRAHVFIFPSIVEGFGMVLYEAMAAGLPVITTPNTAGPDIMTDGREGFITPIRDPDAIASRLEVLYTDEDGRLEMATAALARAARSSWEAYEARIAALVDEILT